MNKKDFDKRVLGMRKEARSLLGSVRAGLKGKTYGQPERSFVVFAPPRSGSTLYVSLLNSHPDITCLGEILNQPALAPIAMAKRELARVDSTCRGFKLLNYQLLQQMNGRQIERMKDWFRSGEITVFHLRREHLLRHTLSNLYAQQRGVYHSTGVKKDTAKTINVSPDSLLRSLKWNEQLMEMENEFLSDIPRHEIVYETDLATPEAQQATADRTFRQLGFEPVPASSPLKPVTPREYSSFVENWDEVAAALAPTSWARFLEN